MKHDKLPWSGETPSEVLPSLIRLLGDYRHPPFKEGVTRRSDGLAQDPFDARVRTIATARRARVCPRWAGVCYLDKRNGLFAGLYRSPLTDSNRRPLLYEEGLCVN